MPVIRRSDDNNRRVVRRVSLGRVVARRVALGRVAYKTVARKGRVAV